MRAHEVSQGEVNRDEQFKVISEDGVFARVRRRASGEASRDGEVVGNVRRYRVSGDFEDGDIWIFWIEE